MISNFQQKRANFLQKTLPQKRTKISNRYSLKGPATQFRGPTMLLHSIFIPINTGLSLKFFLPFALQTF
jgi:hypothetical protein